MSSEKDISIGYCIYHYIWYDHKRRPHALRRPLLRRADLPCYQETIRPFALMLVSLLTRVFSPGNGCTSPAEIASNSVSHYIQTIQRCCPADSVS
jgi:hypothetical protein